MFANTEIWTQNNTQRYKCLSCNKTLKKLNSELIWYDYTVGKQAQQQLADK